MRMEQRQLLTPRMIQSMEILQLPLMALEERIEQELQNNPVLELRDGDLDAPQEVVVEDIERTENAVADEQALVVREGQDAADFERLARIGEYFENEEFNTNSSMYRTTQQFDGERDKKLDAMNNTPDRGLNLTEHL